jgi:DNA-binding CsgD family transcriptional regulator
MSGRRQPELTDGQKDCLRLVGDHFTSKEIARQLGISPYTVDQRLDAARQKLGAPNRTDAARLFATIDSQSLSQRLVYQSILLPAERDQPNSFGHPNQGEQKKDDENSSEYSFEQNMIFRRWASFFSVPPIGGKRHNLPKQRVLLNALNIAFYSTITIAMLIIVITGAMRMVG